MQMDWLDELTQRIAPGNAAKRQLLGESLIVMGQIGGNDYNSWFSTGRPREEVENIIPEVITYISHFIKDLILFHGAKAFMVPNIFPVGCWASFMVPNILSIKLLVREDQSVLDLAPSTRRC